MFTIGARQCYDEVALSVWKKNISTHSFFNGVWSGEDCFGAFILFFSHGSGRRAKLLSLFSASS